MVTPNLHLVTMPSFLEGAIDSNCCYSNLAEANPFGPVNPDRIPIGLACLGAKNCWLVDFPVVERPVIEKSEAERKSSLNSIGLSNQTGSNSLSANSRFGIDFVDWKRNLHLVGTISQTGSHHSSEILHRLFHCLP